MRLVELRLLRFGHFTDARLRFGPDGGGLHVLCGSNEAGKSTTLRALVGFLYGFPSRTKDGFLHPMQELEVGATLLTSDGRTLDLQRKKQTKRSLVRASDAEPVDDATLGALLAGVGEERYRRAFGLNHQTLREGARALLSEGGDVGGSLFDAGVGGRAIQTVITQLERESDALYTPRGRKQLLHTAMKELAARRKQRREAALSSDEWKQTQRDVREAQKERAGISARKRELELERRRLERLERTLPLVARRRALLDQRGALEEVVRIDADAADRRKAAEQARRSALGVRDRERSDLAELEAKIAGLSVPEALLRVPRARIESLQGLLARHAEQQVDLPKRRGERSALARELEDARARLGRPVDAGTTGEAITDALEARLGEQGRRREALRSELRQAEKTAADCGAALEATRGVLAALGAPRAVAPLRAATEAAAPLADAAQQVAESEGRLRRAQEALRRAREALDPPLADLRARVPASGVVEHFAKRFHDLEGRRGLLERKRSEAQDDRLATETALRADEAAGGVPTEEQLLEERAGRDALFEPIRRCLDTGERGTADPDAYAREVGRADGTADRLRREAERVARHAQLVAKLEETRVRLERAQAGQAALEAERADCRSEWHAAFSGAGVEPRTPEEMGAWLGMVERARDLEDGRDEAAAAHARLSGRVAELAARAREALALAAPDEDPPADLAALLERGRAVLAEESEAAHRRESSTQRLGALEAQLGEADRERDRCAAAWEEWRRAWSQTMARLGLGPDAEPEEASARVMAQRAVREKEREVEKLTRRIEAMEGDALALAAEVDRLVAELAPELSEALPTAEARGSELVTRHGRALADAERRADLQERLAATRQRLADHEAEALRADETLAALSRAASVAEPGLLPEAERRSAEASKLEEELRRVEEQLVALGDGLDLPALLAETADVDPGQSRLRLEEARQELDALGATEEQATKRALSQEAALEAMRASAGAGPAAEELEATLATVRERTERYARLRLARAVLVREVERYRAANEQPLLARASELFGRLTRGAWGGLKVGYKGGDEPELLCVRADGKDETVEVLSDGTMDQLYLALRLSSLELHAQSAEPLPVVLDDALVHFDDARARAAFEVLGEVADRFQILFFTHHARMRELALDAVPAERLRVHDLDAL